MTTTPTNGAAPATEPPAEPGAEPIDLNKVRAERNPSAAAAPPYRSAEEITMYPYVGQDGFGRPTCACGKNGTSHAHGGFDCAGVRGIQASIALHSTPPRTSARVATMAARTRRLLEKATALVQRLEENRDEPQQ